tara:strand:- start:1624 stop:1818 length:195 start_codon:yes stop_codon:yes gene_type:complete
MRLKEAINEKIDMYDKCIIALGHEPEPDTPAWDMIYFLEEERNRLRAEAKELDNGTHWVYTGRE